MATYLSLRSPTQSISLNSQPLTLELVPFRGQELPLVRHKICECVASLARTICDDAREAKEDGDSTTPSAETYWPEVVFALWQCAQDPDHRQRESALTVFRYSSHHCCHSLRSDSL